MAIFTLSWIVSQKENNYMNTTSNIHSVMLPAAYIDECNDQQICILLVGLVLDV